MVCQLRGAQRGAMQGGPAGFRFVVCVYARIVTTSAAGRA